MGYVDTARYNNWQRVDTKTHTIIGPFGNTLAKVETPDIDLGTRYTIEFTVVDDSSIDHVRSVIEGKQLDRVSVGLRAEKHVRLVGSTRGATSVINSLSGGTAYVYMADEVGHERRSVGVRRRNVVGTVAEKVPTEDLPAGADSYVANKFGTASGFTAGVGEIPTAVQGGSRLASDISDKPYAYAQAVTNLSNYKRIVGRTISNPGGLAQAMGEQYWNMQKRNNPYSDQVRDQQLFDQLLDGNVNLDQDERVYLAYARGWYKGYVGFSVLTAGVSSGVAQTVKSSKKVGKVLGKLDDASAGRLSKSWTYYKKLKSPSTYVPDTVGRQFVKRGVPNVGLSDSQLRAALGTADTVGGKVGVLYRFRKVDTDLKDLSDDQTAELSRLLRRTGDDGSEFVNDVDSDTLRRFFGTCSGAGSAGLMVHGGVGSAAGSVGTGISADCPDGVPDDLRDDVARQSNDLADNVDGFSADDKDTLTKMYANLDESRDGGLTAEEVNKLGRGLRAADGVTEGPGNNPSEVLNELKSLTEKEPPIDGFLDGSGLGEDYYKGISGEADIATALFEKRDIDASDVDMN